MSSGRAFHKVGALCENALYPYVLRLHLGTIRSFFLEDLRFHNQASHPSSRSHMSGLIPFVGTIEQTTKTMALALKQQQLLQ